MIFHHFISFLLIIFCFCDAIAKTTAFIPYHLPTTDTMPSQETDAGLCLLLLSLLSQQPSNWAALEPLLSNLGIFGWSQVEAPGFSGSLMRPEASSIYDHVTFALEPHFEAVLRNICASKAQHSADVFSCFHLSVKHFKLPPVYALPLFGWTGMTFMIQNYSSNISSWPH